MAEETTEYIDLGDRWLEIDNSGPVQRRTVLPKSTRDMGVAAAVRQELEARIETEFPKVEEVDPKDNLPPVESDDDRAKREKATAAALAKADEQQAAPVEEAPAQQSSSKSSKS